MMTLSLIRPVLRRKRGATLSVVWNIDTDTDSEIDGLTPMRAELKPINGAQDRSPGDNVDASAVFDLVYVAATESADAYIQGEISATDCAALTARYYIADLRLAFDGGDVVQTDPVTIDLQERVTEPAA
jgi:hypothetical protein